MIDNSMVVYKGITLLEQTVMFNEDIKVWIRQTTDQKTCANCKKFPTEPIVIREES